MAHPRLSSVAYGSVPVDNSRSLKTLAPIIAKNWAFPGCSACSYNVGTELSPMFCGLYPKMGGGDRAEETAPPSPLGPDNRQLVGASAAGVAATTTAMEARQRVLAAGIVAGRADMPLAIAGLIALEVVERLRSPRGQRAMVAVVRVKAIVYVAVKAMMTMKPGTGSNEEPSDKPVGAIVSIRCTVVGRIVEIPIGTGRRHSNADVHADLGRPVSCTA